MEVNNRKRFLLIFIKALWASAIFAWGLFRWATEVWNPWFEIDLSTTDPLEAGLIANQQQKKPLRSLLTKLFQEESAPEPSKWPAETTGAWNFQQIKNPTPLHQDKKLVIENVEEDEEVIHSSGSEEKIITSPSSTRVLRRRSTESSSSSAGTALGIEKLTVLDQTDTYINEVLENAQKNLPPTGSEEDFSKKYQEICKKYSFICSIVSFDSTHTTKTKYIYLSLAIYTINQIDKLLVTETKVISQINGLTINGTQSDNRWYYTAQKITTNISIMKSYLEFIEIVSHELWHLIDIDVLVWNARYFDEQFTEAWQKNFRTDDPSLNFYRLSRVSESTQKKWSTYLDFVSGYAQTNPFEDFAETLNFYLHDNKAFNLMKQDNPILQKKYQFMEKLFWGKYLYAGWNDVQKIQKNQKMRPWDSTRFN